MRELLLVGVDGGATEVKAHAAACDDLSRPTSFQLRPETAARQYPRRPDFAPLSVAEQLAQRDAAKIKLSSAESEQGRLWIEAAAEAVVEVARQCGARRVLVGIGMPGLKTPDGRGICVINNGPRIPGYLDSLEQLIGASGAELAAQVAALGSDADYCGLGEEYAAEGLFRDVQNAYYVGGGTGIADALKLHGRLVPFDQAKSWIMKAWQIPSALGPTFEKLVSASSINRVFTDLRGTEARRHEGTKGSGEQPVYPEIEALRGNLVAIAWLDTAALVLAELIFERLHTIGHGRANAPHRGEAYTKLNPDHEYRGLVLDRVVIGQRVGLIYADAAYRAVFSDKVDAYVAALVADSGDAGMAKAYLSPGSSQLKPGFLRASKLRAAPALGAAVAAVHALSKR